jgi:hypothetical protein
MQIVKIGQKIKRQCWFCVLHAVHSKLYTKTALSLYFLSDFNDLNAILSRIVSQF